MAARQPFLHDAVVVLAAPMQLWSRADGSMREPIDGLYSADARALSTLDLSVEGSEIEPIGFEALQADRVRFSAMIRGFDGPGPDPRVRLERERTVVRGGFHERIVVTSGLADDRLMVLRLTVASDLAPMDAVKNGAPTATRDVRVMGDEAAWTDGRITVRLTASGSVRPDGPLAAVVEWRLLVPAGGAVDAQVQVVVEDAHAVVAAPAARPPLPRQVPTGRPDLDAWLRVALADLEALQLVLPGSPGDVFLAAGAPWFLTLFGRDALWTARLLLPLDAGPAAGTLRVLASLQGTTDDASTAEQPGKILHELRGRESGLAGVTRLPPKYYGTVDATALWVLLLHDAWRAGLPDSAVRDLLPNLLAALGWIRQAAERTGFVEYHDTTGRGLSNQGWKDSGDSVQWQNGAIAVGPIALCEVQGYAHEAAQAGAVLLDALGAPGAARLRAWADALKARFRDAFWVDDGEGGYPAIAVDHDGAAVDSLTSNIGHLLGTGILDAADEHRVAALLVSERLSSGFGLRTLSSSAAGYWPQSYHGGSVWAHDTGIAVHGLLRAGFAAEAADLASGLLTAARAFGFRMPELFSGLAVTADRGSPDPYPAACRPQAWSAAAAVVVAQALGAELAETPNPSGDARRTGHPASAATPVASAPESTKQ